MIRVLLVDDTRLYLEALAGILAVAPDIGSVETAIDAESALQQVSAFRPDVILLNTAAACSTEVVEDVARTAIDVPVVALGVGENEEEVIAWAEAGVAGYLFRGSPLSELVPIIQSAVRGETPFPPRLTATLVRRVAALASEHRPATPIDCLTRREFEVLTLIEEGLSNKEIAHRLSIEVRTVKNHVHNLLGKMHVAHRGEAAARLRRAASRPVPVPSTRKP
jgi:DNA-binding NarL/FixJ family response regulator